MEAKVTYGLSSVAHSGARSGMVEVAPDSKISWYGYSQLVSPVHFGQIYRFSCWIKTENVTGGLGAYFGMELGDSHQANKRVVGMDSGRLTGTNDWTRVEANLFVPKGLYSLGVTLCLHGTGRAYFDDARLEVVRTAVPLPEAKVSLKLQTSSIKDQLQLIGADSAMDRNWFQRTIQDSDTCFVAYSMHIYLPTKQYPLFREDVQAMVKAVRDHSSPVEISGPFKIGGGEATFKPALVLEFGHLQDDFANGNQDDTLRRYEAALWTANANTEIINHGAAGSLLWCLQSMYYSNQLMAPGLWEFKDKQWAIRPVYYAHGGFGTSRCPIENVRSGVIGSFSSVHALSVIVVVRPMSSRYAEDGKVITFFGTGDPGVGGFPGPGRPPGGVWVGVSNDGRELRFVQAPPFPVADPGAVPLRESGWIVVGTGPPVRGRPS